jgi:NAD(P)-dependent dehydrogenase (short-subunit alcohol dehydrogenase family)
MEIDGRHVVVTGGAGGIGRALARAFAGAGAKAVVVADLDGDAARAVAAELPGGAGLGAGFDAGTEDGVRGLIAEATAAHGPIDIFVSNAGVPGGMGGPEVEEAEWDLAWRVNLMAHVWAARALLPDMVARGDGYLVSTASAAGLLTQVSSAPYSVTKAAAVSLAEWLSSEYGDRGVKVSCICPQAVQTAMLDLAMDEPAGAATLRAGGIIAPEQVAEAVLAGIADERFLILPHEEVAHHLAYKGAKPERWLGAMRKFVREARAGTTS